MKRLSSSIEKRPQTASVAVEGDGSKRRMGNLPLMRFTTFVSLAVALDALVCILLWLSGGDTEYMETSVEDFSFTRSVFDLACMAAVRGVLLVACFYYLEHYSLLTVSLDPDAKERITSSKKLAHFCRAVIGLITGATLVYALVKGSFILQAVVKGTWENGEDSDHVMHGTYKALCVLAVVFPVVELGLLVGSWWFLRHLVHTQRLRLVINSRGDGEEEGEGEKPRRKADIWRLVVLAKPEYPMLLVGIVALVISSAAFSVTPYLFGKVINYAIPSTNCTGKFDGKEPPPNVTCTPYGIDRMNHIVLYLVAIFVGGSLAVMVRAMMFNLAGERFVARLRKMLFASILTQEMGFFDKNRTGELTNRLSADTQVLQSAVTENISMLARYTLQMFISIGLMFYISVKLTAVLLSVVPIIAIAAVQYGRFLKQLRKDFQDKLAHASSTAEESLSNMVTVRSFSNEPKMVALYSRDINDSYALGRKLALLIGLFMGVVTMCMYGASSLVLWYGGYLVFHSKLDAGTLISLMLYTLNLAMSFGFLANLYGEFMQAVGASIRIFELLDRKSLVKDGDTTLGVFKGAIDFNKVCFTYPSRPDEEVLKEVSFTVAPGQVVALVGPSGGGKSTVVRLIEHFYELTTGTILLSGSNVRELDPAWYRRHVGLVSQEPVLFACSIADNISYGKEDATREEIEEAARQANANDFIESFEEGYNTMVGERGVRLSGGQKQRVAIARALLMNPEILLLDEATSALDAESEHLVQEAIDRAMKGRTVLIIAHRLSTVRDASQVIVVEKGKVVEQGTHDQLVALAGVYKQLVLRQLTAGDTELSQPIN